MNIRTFVLAPAGRLEIVPGRKTGVLAEQQVKEDAEKISKFLSQIPGDLLVDSLALFTRNFGTSYLNIALKKASK